MAIVTGQRTLTQAELHQFGWEGQGPVEVITLADGRLLLAANSPQAGAPGSIIIWRPGEPDYDVVTVNGDIVEP
jgi:hypothetical protein